MISLLKRLFGSKDRSVYDPIKFETIKAEELSARFPAALLQLTNLELDGFLIKNFLTESEVNQLLKALEGIDDEEKSFTSVGYTHPMVFAEYNGRIANLSESERQEKSIAFFEKNQKYRDGFFEKFGVDLFKKLHSFLSSISGGLKVENPKGLRNAGVYPFGNFRFLKPGGGFMAIHCGNFFQARFKEVYRHLSEQVAVRNQLSYFIMLKKPEEGGKLTIFNFRWEDGQTKVDNLEDKNVILPSGKVIQPDNTVGIEPFDLDPEQGDMILFQGGDIWHRVSNVEGAGPRITFGGFMGKGLDGETFLYWT